MDTQSQSLHPNQANEDRKPLLRRLPCPYCHLKFNTGQHPQKYHPSGNIIYLDDQQHPIPSSCWVPDARAGFHKHCKLALTRQATSVHSAKLNNNDPRNAARPTSSKSPAMEHRQEPRNTPASSASALEADPDNASLSTSANPSVAAPTTASTKVPSPQPTGETSSSRYVSTLPVSINYRLCFFF